MRQTSPPNRRSADAFRSAYPALALPWRQVQSGGTLGGQLCNPAQGSVEQEPGEQDQASIAVGFEYGQAIVRVGDVETDNLPGEVSGEDNEPERENDPSACGKTRRAQENDRERIEQSEHRLGALAEQQRGGFDADQRI